MSRNTRTRHAVPQSGGKHIRSREESEGVGRRILAWVRDIIEGLLIGSVILAMLAFFLAVVPMLHKRAAAPSSEEQPFPVADTGSRQCRTPEVSLPPATYVMACDADDLAIRTAFLSEISSMRPVSAFWPPEWLTLTNVVLPKDGNLAHQRVLEIVNGIYSDSPELSVYTNGQCWAVSGFLSQWRIGGDGAHVTALPLLPVRLGLGITDSSTQEENKRELAEVTNRLASVAQELADDAEAPEHDEKREVLGRDGLYAALVYKWVGTHSKYSDDDGDLTHINDIYGALFEGEAQCYGTACALKALLERGGIPAFVATGEHSDSPNTAGHAWTVARMGGQWFAFDGTGAQVLQEDDPIDLQLIAIRRGKWQSFAVPIDEYVGRSGLQLDAMCVRLMDAYERQVSSIEQEIGVPRYGWMELASKEERDEEYRALMTGGVRLAKGVVGRD